MNINNTKNNTKDKAAVAVIGEGSAWARHCTEVSQDQHLIWLLPLPRMGFPGGSEVKASACIAGDLGSIPGSGRSPGEGNGNPLQYSCLENPMDRGA